MVKIRKPVKKLIHHTQQLLSTSDLVERWKSVPVKETTIRNWRTNGYGPKWGRRGDAPRAPVVYRLDVIMKWEKENLYGFIPPESV